MGMYTSAYLAYGVRITDTDPDTLDRTIPGGTEVGHLHAGGYDRDMTFLVTKCTEAELGSSVAFGPSVFTAAQYEQWNAELSAAVQAVGAEAEHEPAWLLIPNVD